MVVAYVLCDESAGVWSYHCGHFNSKTRHEMVTYLLVFFLPPFFKREERGADDPTVDLGGEQFDESKKDFWQKSAFPSDPLCEWRTEEPQTIFARVLVCFTSQAGQASDMVSIDEVNETHRTEQTQLPAPGYNRIVDRAASGITCSQSSVAATIFHLMCVVVRIEYFVKRVTFWRNC
jgi:hypothetical protein